MYKAIKNKPIIQERNGLTYQENRPTKYSVIKDEQIICYIPDWFKNPESIASAIAEMLNRERKIQLNLEI